MEQAARVGGSPHRRFYLMSDVLHRIGEVSNLRGRVYVAGEPSVRRIA